MVNITPTLNVSVEEIEAFCRRWKVKEFALFGSALRGDFRPDSDVDVMVTFEEGARRGLFALVDMQLELEKLFGRPVDLLTEAVWKPVGIHFGASQFWSPPVSFTQRDRVYLVDMV